ncbi:unnamed protein product [Rotaria socialis]
MDKVMNHYFQTIKLTIETNTSTNLLQSKPLFYFEQQQQQNESITKIMCVIILTLIGLFLFGSIRFGLMIITRLIVYSSRKTADQWGTLRKESNV